MENVFLQVNKNYLGLGLKSLEILILCQIEEFERNNCKCYVTNEQFSEMFGESVSTVKRALDKLEDLWIIERNTKVINGHGRANRQRVISLNDNCLWKIGNEPSKNNNDLSNTMVGSNVDNGRFKNDECKVHNDPIKENIKNNLKENYTNNSTYKFYENIDIEWVCTEDYPFNY